jgi:hypothetical protein
MLSRVRDALARTYANPPSVREKVKPLQLLDASPAASCRLLDATCRQYLNRIGAVNRQDWHVALFSNLATAVARGRQFARPVKRAIVHAKKSTALRRADTDRTQMRVADLMMTAGECAKINPLALQLKRLLGGDK